MKKKGGVYYNKLNKIFFSILGVCIFLLICISFVIIKSQIEKENTNINNTSNYYIQLYSNNFKIIENNVISFTDNPILNDWINSKGNERNYNQIGLYNLVKANYNSIDKDLDYNISVIDPFSDKVVYLEGAVSIETFISSLSELDSIDKITKNLKSNYPSQLIPNYDKDGELTTLYLLSKKKKKDSDEFVIILATINLKIEENIDLAFVSSNGDIIESTKDCFSLSEKNNLINYAQDTELININIVDNKYYLKQLSGIPYTIAIKVINSNKQLVTLEIFLFILFLGIAITLYFVSLQAKNTLYNPIKELITDENIKTNKTEGQIESKTSQDEFAYVHDKIKNLSEDLQEALHNEELLKNQRYYLNLVNGLILKEEDKKDTSSYFIGFIPLPVLLEQTDKQLILQLGLELTNEPIRDIHFVRKDGIKAIIIIHCNTQVEAFENIKNIMDKFGSEREMQFALSNQIIGKKNIHKGYKQAESLYEYHHSFPNKLIISQADIDSLTYHSLYYPLHEEKRIVNMIIEGNSHYKDVLESVINQNKADKEFSYSLKKELILFLVSSIRRVFQELKTTPELLINHKIDWNYFNLDYDFDQEIATIYSICDEIVLAINESNHEKNTEMKSLILDFISQHYMEDIKLQDIANLLNLTPKYTSNLFASLSDINFKTYLTNYRIDKAKELIKENPNLKVLELSSLVGFNSSCSFIRAFNRVIGMTPKAYVKKICKEKIFDSF